MEEQSDLSGSTPSYPEPENPDVRPVGAQPVTQSYPEAQPNTRPVDVEQPAIPDEGVQIAKRKAQEIFDELIKVENVFKDVFRESLYINTTKVKKGGTSGYIYVPKHYINHAVTVIIWNKPALEE